VWVAAAGAALGWAVLGGWLIRAPQRSSL